MKLLPARHTNEDSQHSGDNLGRGMDFALVILVFLGLGALVDHWLGTWPAFAVGLVVVSTIGQFVRMYYEYNATMERLETERAAARQGRAG